MSLTRSHRFAGALAAFASLVCAASVAASALENVIVLRGHATPGRHLVAFSYDGDRDTVNGFRLSFTCGGKPASEDRDLRTIVDGGDDRKALARVRSGGKVRFTRSGELSRFSEDGPFPLGKATITVDAKLSKDGRRRVLKGTARVRGKNCDSVTLTFRASGTF